MPAPPLGARLRAAAVATVCREIPEGFASPARIEAPTPSDGQALALVLTELGRLGRDVAVGGAEGNAARGLVLSVDRLGEPDAPSWVEAVEGELERGGILLALEPDVASWHGRLRLLRRGPAVERRLRPDVLRQALFAAGFRWLLERPAQRGEPFKVVMARAGVEGGFELGLP
jgi:hypothetical protein